MGVCGAIAYTKYGQITKAMSEGAKRQQPPEAVTSIVVNENEWPFEMIAVGTLAPVRGAVLAAEEMGRVEKILFQPGANVAAGETLVQLDTRVERAQLQAAEAQLTMLTASLARQKDLREKKANTQSSLENAQAAFVTGQAEISRLKALIDRKTITAPFKGRTGVRLVNEGEVIPAGREVVALQNLEELYVNISLPQKVVSLLPGVEGTAAAATGGIKVRFTTNAFPGREFLAKIQSIDPQVDGKTRNVKLQALFANKGDLLLPGMFVTVTVAFPGIEKVIAVPESSILFAPYGDMVYKIERAEKGDRSLATASVNLQPVKLGRRRGDLVVITAGLKPGEEIVSSGVFKLRPNTQVIVNNSVVPEMSLSPSPGDS